jgi:hypothetical protein
MNKKECFSFLSTFDEHFLYSWILTQPHWRNHDRGLRAFRAYHDYKDTIKDIAIEVLLARNNCDCEACEKAKDGCLIEAAFKNQHP